MFSIVGCKKKVAPPPPPPPPPPVVTPAPTAQITATPNVVTAGNSVVLSWSSTNASTASITGLGDVPTSGTRTVNPAASTVYTLTAKGAGGSASASVRVTVNPQPPEAPLPPRSLTAEEEFRANVQDIFFDYDKSSVRPEGITTLTQDAAYFNAHPTLKILIGGYCDERGSAEYNIALGEERAQAAKKALVNDGVDGSRLRVISYGKEKPFCTESTEECWQKNRRAGFSIDR